MFVSCEAKRASVKLYLFSQLPYWNLMNVFPYLNVFEELKPSLIVGKIHIILEIMYYAYLSSHATLS